MTAHKKTNSHSWRYKPFDQFDELDWWRWNHERHLADPDPPSRSESAWIKRQETFDQTSPNDVRCAGKRVLGTEHVDLIEDLLEATEPPWALTLLKRAEECSTRTKDRVAYLKKCLHNLPVSRKIRSLVADLEKAACEDEIEPSGRITRLDLSERLEKEQRLASLRASIARPTIRESYARLQQLIGPNFGPLYDQLVDALGIFKPALSESQLKRRYGRLQRVLENASTRPTASRSLRYLQTCLRNAVKPKGKRGGSKAATIN